MTGGRQGRHATEDLTCTLFWISQAVCNTTGMKYITLSTTWLTSSSVLSCGCPLLYFQQKEGL